LLWLLVALLIVILTSPRLTRKASRRRRAESNGLGEVQVYADEPRAIAEIARDNLIARLWIWIENAKRRDDGSGIAGTGKSWPVVEDPIAIVVKSSRYVERPA